MVQLRFCLWHFVFRYHMKWLPSEHQWRSLGTDQIFVQKAWSFLVLQHLSEVCRCVYSVAAHQSMNLLPAASLSVTGSDTAKLLGLLQLLLRYRMFKLVLETQTTKHQETWAKYPAWGVRAKPIWLLKGPQSSRKLSRTVAPADEMWEPLPHRSCCQATQKKPGTIHCVILLVSTCIFVSDLTICSYKFKASESLKIFDPINTQHKNKSGLYIGE